MIFSNFKIDHALTIKILSDFTKTTHEEFDKAFQNLNNSLVLFAGLIDEWYQIFN